MFLNEWEEKIINKIIQKSKYIDQPALIELIKEKYVDKFEIIDNKISMTFKNRKENCYATHYIRRHIQRMYDDYNQFIIGEEKCVLQ